MVEEFLDKIIKERRSVSQFLNKSVSREIIDGLIGSASFAPSSCNTQPWFFLVFESAEARRKLLDFVALGYDFTKIEIEKEHSVLGSVFSKSLDSFYKYGQFDEAPVYILVFSRPYDKTGLAQAIKISGNKKIKSVAEESVKTSVAMAMQNFLLAVHAKGLGARIKDGIKFFVMHEELKNKFYEEFGIPKDYWLLSGIQLGYPSDNFREPAKRLSMDKIRKYF